MKKRVRTEEGDHHTLWDGGWGTLGNLVSGAQSVIQRVKKEGERGRWAPGCVGAGGQRLRGVACFHLDGSFCLRLRTSSFSHTPGMLTCLASTHSRHQHPCK